MSVQIRVKRWVVPRLETIAIAKALTIGAGGIKSQSVQCMNETIGGLKAEEIGGAKVVAVGGVSTESVGVSKSIGAGTNISFTAGGKMAQKSAVCFSPKPVRP